MGKPPRVFLSSTWLDLESEREAVEKALYRMQDTAFAGMEYFGSRPETPKDVSLAEVDRSDVYIGIFAHRYGSGITEAEYRRARYRDIPCLVYLKDESVPVVPFHMEIEPENVAKLEGLKRELKAHHTVSSFQNPDHLATQVVADLHKLFNRMPTAKDQQSTEPKSKYEIHIGEGQGIVIGDQLQVTQCFGSGGGEDTMSTAEASVDTDAFAQQLYQLLIGHFDLEELRTLCFDLGVEYDDLRGEGRSAKSRELVRLMQRRGQLNRFHTIIQRSQGILS